MEYIAFFKLLDCEIDWLKRHTSLVVPERCKLRVVACQRERIYHMKGDEQDR